METLRRQRALLLGLVEVTRPLSGLDMMGRARVTQMCHTAVATRQVEDPDWMGQPTSSHMLVEVVLGQQQLQVITGGCMVSQHNLAEMSVIAVVRKTNGHLVYIGKCQIKRKRLAVVLDMTSELEADQLVKDFQSLKLHPPAPAPKPEPDDGGRSRQSSVSTEEDQPYENSYSQDCFNLVGITLEESEYIYIKRATPQQPEYSPSVIEQEISHFLTNEHDYLNTIATIKHARKIMTPELKNLLRGIEVLADIHSDMYRELLQVCSSCSKIAQVFISRQEQLVPYKYYLMNAPKISLHLGQLPEEVREQFPTLVEDITKSWKRLHYYFMSLEKMLTSTPTEERPVVREAVDMFRDLYRQGDSGILIDAVKESPFSLHTLSTLLLHSAFFIKDSTGLLRNKSEYRVLMFAEMIVIALPKGEIYQYEEHLPIKQVHLLPRAIDGKNSFVLELIMGGQRRNKSYTFHARDLETKTAWVDEISRLHLEYMSQVKQKAELRFGSSRQ